MMFTDIKKLIPDNDIERIQRTNSKNSRQNL